MCANCAECVIVAGGTVYAAVTDIAFIDPKHTVWYEITGICSGLSFLLFECASVIFVLMYFVVLVFE